MKRILSLVLLMCVLIGCCGFACAEETRVFVDSTGREVTIPTEITRVAVTGPMAQIVVYSIAPEMMVGISTDWDESAAGLLPEEYYSLPNLGQLYGGKGEMNLETLLASNAQIVIDVGEAKDTIVEDMDSLTEQTGIPFVHVEASLSTFGDAYRMLGDLLGKTEEGEALATYCDETFARANEIAGAVEKTRLLYVTGEEGLNVIANGSYHSEVIDLLSDNLAVVDEPSSKGTGNEVDMEQILAWNPDFVIFAPESIYANVAEMEEWQAITAIANGNYVEVPICIYNWMGFPPSVQRMLGLCWMAKVLYPETADYDMYEEAHTFYEMFFHCDLTEVAYNALVANSLGK